MPVLTQLATKLNTIKFPDKKQIHEWLESAEKGLKPIIEVVGKFAAQANKAAQEVGGWSKVLGALITIRLGGWAGSDNAAGF
jgi:hypothetical protein